MFFGTANNYATADAALDLLGNIAYGGIGQPLIETLAFEGMAASRAAIMPRENPNPGFVVAENDEETVVVIAGADPANGAGLGAAALAGLKDRDGFGINRYIADGALAVLAKMTQQGYGFKQRVSLWGHSYGGAIAIAMMRGLMAVGYDSRQVEVGTFGSPRPGNSILAQAMSAMTIIRYMAVNDIVPHIPPHGDESPQAHALLGNLASAALNGEVHEGFGISLYDDFHTVDEALNPIPSNEAVAQIAHWLLEFPLGFTQTHSWAVYKRLIHGLAADAAVPTTTHGGSQSINGDPPVAGSSRNSPACQVARQALVLNANATATSIRRVDKSLLMTVDHSTGFYEVKWMGSTIGTYVKRGDALRVRADGNRVIKRLQRAGDIPSHGWVRAVAAFLQAASEEGGGATPAFHVTGTL